MFKVYENQIDLKDKAEENNNELSFLKWSEQEQQTPII